MDKIQELTSKLYAEGVEKGKTEADNIIKKAEDEASRLMDEAKKEAEKVSAKAKKEADELRENTQSELKLYAAQASEALKTEITNLLTDKLATSNVKAATQDKAFMQKIIVELVQNWAKTEKLTIGAANSEELKKYISENAKTLLDKGLKIETVNGIGSAFTVSPEDGSYKVKFGEDEFIEYFKEFLRPQIQKLLFG